MDTVNNGNCELNLFYTNMVKKTYFDRLISHKMFENDINTGCLNKIIIIKECANRVKMKSLY